MAEKSLFWFTDGFTGATGDGSAPYTQQEFSDRNRLTLGEGVIPFSFVASTGSLRVDGTASPLTVTEGAALVRGFHYHSDTIENIAVATPVVNTTGGRVVLRANYTAATVRLALKMSADGVAAIPALTQIANDTWEVSLATFTITTGGVIAVSSVSRDERFAFTTLALPDLTTIGRDVQNRFQIADGGVSTAKIADSAVTTAKVLDSAITAAKIANRTRTFFVPARSNQPQAPFNGVVLADSIITLADALFVVPNDFSVTSGNIVAKAVLQAKATGNIYADVEAVAVTVAGGANFPVFSFVPTAVAMTANHISFIYERSLEGLNIGDFVNISVWREANDPLDTINDEVIALGFLITYPADS